MRLRRLDACCPMPKLLFLVTEDWFFVSHFLPMARAARADGFKVVVATRVRAHGARIEQEGFRVVSLESERRSLGPLAVLGALARIVRVVRAERPDIVHCIALRMVTLGGVAVRIARVPALVLAPTGLGHLWISKSAAARLGRGLVRILVRRLARGRRTGFLFENTDDPVDLGVAGLPAEIRFVGGAGVDPAAFPVTPQPPAPPVKVAVVARMIRPKGLAEAVAAFRAARDAGAPLELHLFGVPDPSNRQSVPEAELLGWAAEDGITWHGATDDVAAVWRDHHIAMLLSWYREGVPRGLIEPAAAGRPIVTTDIPGCRELVRDGIEGLLVPPHDVAGAMRALMRLADDGALRVRLGAAAHARFASRFTEAAVGAATVALYRDLLAGG